MAAMIFGVNLRSQWGSMYQKGLSSSHDSIALRGKNPRAGTRKQTGEGHRSRAAMLNWCISYCAYMDNPLRFAAAARGKPQNMRQCHKWSLCS